MSKTLSGAEHQVLGSGSDEIASGSGKHGCYPRTENSATVGTEILPLFFVRNVCSDDERCASRLCAQRAKCDEVYIFTVEELKAACDQVSQVAESVLRQVGGLFVYVVLHLLKGMLESLSILRREGNGQETTRSNVFADIADHRDLEFFEGDSGVVPAVAALQERFMNLVKKIEGGAVSIACAGEFFCLEERLHDLGVEVKPCRVPCERCECTDVSFIFVGNCFEVRGEIFKGVVAHMSNRSLSGDKLGLGWNLSPLGRENGGRPWFPAGGPQQPYDQPLR